MLKRKTPSEMQVIEDKLPPLIGSNGQFVPGWTCTRFMTENRITTNAAARMVARQREKLGFTGGLHKGRSQKADGNLVMPDFSTTMNAIMTAYEQAVRVPGLEAKIRELEHTAVALQLISDNAEVLTEQAKEDMETARRFRLQQQQQGSRAD